MKNSSLGSLHENIKSRHKRKKENRRPTRAGLPVSWSVVTAAVRPTPEDPRPVVATARGAVCNTYLSEEPKHAFCFEAIAVQTLVMHETELPWK